MTKAQVIYELQSLIKTRDYLILKTGKARSMRESEKAMTLAVYDRQKAALLYAIETVQRAANGG